MRILTVGSMYPPHRLGGQELTWRAAVEALLESGHDVRVLASDLRLPDVSGEDPPHVHRALRWYWRDHRFPRVSLRERIGIERHNAAVLERELEELRPDVVSWWHMGGMSLGLIERVRRADIPAAGLVGDDWPWYGPRVDAWTRLCRRLGPLRLPVERAAGLPSGARIGGAARWIFISEDLRRTARDAGWPSESDPVVPVGIDHRLFAPAPETGWSWRLACVGRLDARKGPDLAVEALARLPREARLALVGRGDPAYEAELRAQIAARGLDGRVEIGPRPHREIPAVYADADAVLFPVRWKEPLGVVPLEAMAVGRPVVATATGGAAEYLRDGVNCLVVEPDADQVAAAVTRLAEDPALRRRLRDGGIRTAGRFSEDRFNRVHEDTLRAAAGL